jgi:hypothetical protein
MEKRPSPLILLVLVVVMCIIALFVLLPATSPLASIRDSDGDGHADATDTFPNNNAEWKDTDGDGFGDKLDKYPTNPAEWADTDNDSWADNIDAFPYDPTEHYDLDGDGIGDNSDAFPTKASQWQDSDGDGYGDNITGWRGDAFPNDRYEWNDSDHDGHGDNSDIAPSDPDIWANGTARIMVTLIGLYNEGYTLIVDAKPFTSEYSNISEYVVVEIGITWYYGTSNSTQVLLTAISYSWFDSYWESTGQAQEVVTAYNGGLYFIDLII